MRWPAAGLIRFMVSLALCGFASSSWADSSAAPEGAALFDFDIPAQPLVSALNRFADASGRSALFPGSLVAERHSSSVHGRYSAKLALQRLLEGSGLEVEEISSGKLTALILKPIPASPSVDAVARADADSLGGYENLIQARVWDALCAQRSTAVDSYRALLRFSVDASGRVQQARLLASTGDGRRDAALLEVLQGIQLDRAPPSGMRQPVTLLILPEQAGGPVCPTRRRLP
jgi:TonB family protein